MSLGCLHSFSHVRPRFEIPQEQILEWLAKMHALAAGASLESEFHSEIRDRLFRVGLGSDRIQSRGIQILDLFRDSVDEMPLFPVNRFPSGVGFEERSDFFEREMDPIFEALYPEGSPLPSHLIHVTCTGYVAPSPAQS